MVGSYGHLKNSNGSQQFIMVKRSYDHLKNPNAGGKFNLIIHLEEVI
jgi:hypothetical protein